MTDVALNPVSLIVGGALVSTSNPLPVFATNQERSVIDFGAVGNGITDDTAAFQAMADFQLTTPGRIYVPPGTYLITSSITFAGSGFSLVGAGGGQNESADTDIPCRILWGGATDQIMFDFGDGSNSYNGPWFQGICLDGASISGVTAVRLRLMRSAYFYDVNARNVALGWDVGTSSFAGTYYRCTAYNTSGDGGWNFRALNHSTTMFRCKHWGGSGLGNPDPATGPVAVQVGVEQHSSQFSIIECDFEAFQVRGGIVFGDVRGFLIDGLYSEAHANNLQGLVDLGVTSGSLKAAGGDIRGCNLIGNSAAAYAVNLTLAAAVSINGNYVAGFNTGFINNVSATQWNAAHNNTTLTETTSNNGRRPVASGAYSATALTDAINIATNLNNGQNFAVTLTASRNLSNPTNGYDGQTGYIYITQGGTGSNALTYSGNWKFPGGVAPTLSTAVGAVDRLKYTRVSSAAVYGELTKDFK